MDKFYLVTETAVYRRRYVTKNLVGEHNGAISNSTMINLLGSRDTVELPEGYTLESPIKEIIYKSELVDLSNMDAVTKQCVSNLTSLYDLEPVVKKVKKPFVNDGTLNKDKEYRTNTEVKPVKPKKQRVDWAALAEVKE